MHFVGNLILSTSCEFHYEDVLVALFINSFSYLISRATDLKYCVCMCV